MFPMKLQDTTLTPCELVGMGLLRSCVSPDEARFYVFDETLGVGGNGFVFACRYKNNQRRVVKMVIVGSPYDSPVKLDRTRAIYKVPEPLLRREWEMHQRLQHLTSEATSPQFRVLNTYGNLCVFKPPLYQGQIAAYVMDELPFHPLQHYLDQSNIPLHMMKHLKSIPRIISAFHRYGMAHSDLHAGNIAFDPTPGSRRLPYVIDFGRTMVLKSEIPVQSEQARFRVLEYTIPLDMFVRTSDQPPKIIAKLYNAYLEGMDIGTDRMSVSGNLRKSVDKVFTPFPSFEKFSNDEVNIWLQEREHIINKILNANAFGRKGKRYTLSYLNIVTT